MKIIPVQPTTGRQLTGEPSRRTLGYKFHPSRRTLTYKYHPSRRTLIAKIHP